MKNNWQKKLTISLACATFLTATSTSYASYNLNPEVKTATTALKNRKVGQQIVSLPDIQNFLADYDGQNIAIVFGPEKTGLTAQEIELAHAVLNIPTTAKVPSINLAQAVILCCYELSKNTIKTKRIGTKRLPTVKEQQMVAENIKQLLTLLDLPPTLSKGVTDKKLNDLNDELKGVLIKFIDS